MVRVEPVGPIDDQTSNIPSGSRTSSAAAVECCQPVQAFKTTPSKDNNAAKSTITPGSPRTVVRDFSEVTPACSPRVFRGSGDADRGEVSNTHDECEAPTVVAPAMRIPNPVAASTFEEEEKEPRIPMVHVCASTPVDVPRKNDGAGGVTHPIPSHRNCAVAVGIIWASMIATGIGVGVAVGITVNAGAGVGVAIGLVLTGLICYLTVLIGYMVMYNNGLKRNHMYPLVSRLGFATNYRFNIAMRCIMVNVPWDCVTWAMGNESKDRLKEQHSSVSEEDDVEVGCPASEVATVVKPCPAQRGGVCFIGDSEFTFWHHLAEDMLPFSRKCFNAGFGGSRTDDLLRHLEPLCLSWDPCAVVVHVGGNDYDFEPLVTPATVAKKLVDILQRISSHPSVTSVGWLLTPRRAIYSDHKWLYLKNLAEEGKQELGRRGLSWAITMFDVRDLEHPLSDYHEVDCVHLNSIGHHKKAQRLLKLLEDANWKDNT